MQFMTDLHNPPEGIPKYIKPLVYEAMTAEEQYHYEPEWARHVMKKMRAYDECECCGHMKYIGWVEREIPLGDPYRYIYTRQMIPYEIQKRTIDAILNTNVLASRILGSNKGKKI